MSWTRSATSRRAGNEKPHISEKARQRPVRVLPPDDRAEMEAGHLIPRPDPLQQEDTIGGFGHQPEARAEFAPDSSDSFSSLSSDSSETDTDPRGFGASGYPSSSFDDRDI